jgi:hypothetical protein
MKNRPLQTHTIITIHRPVLWFVGFVAIVSIILISLWISYEYGRKTAGYDSTEAGIYIDELRAQLEESEAKIIESERRATMLISDSRIDIDASAELKETLELAQDEVLALKKELKFYKSIVAPEQGGRNLAIQSIKLKPDDAGGYNYNIIVSQRGRNDQFVRGTINVSIKGKKKGKSLTLKLADVSKDVKNPMKFGFKYFQNFEGVMNLPTAFQPDNLRIVVKPSTGKIKAIDEQFVWSELTTGGA